MTVSAETGVNKRIDFEDLVRHDRVHGRVYYDEEIFRREVEQIWRKEWVFACHDSEIAQPGDYVTRLVSLVPLVITRDEDGDIHAMINRCPHRGNVLCMRDSGSAQVFRCAYHGWTFNNGGKLLGRTFRAGYAPGYGKEGEELNLVPVPRLETYRGFVFVNFSPEGPSLIETLGAAVPHLDRYVDRSPTGEIDIVGVEKMVIRANWKMPLENSVDDYHAGFVHRGIWDMDEDLRKVWYSTEDADSEAVNIDLGNGHTAMDFGSGIRTVGGGVTESVVPDEVQREYEDSLRRRLGEEGANAVLKQAVPHMMVFPNLFMLQNDLRIITPVGVRTTHYYHYVFNLRGADPLINRARLRRHEVSYGPAGMVLQDDIEVFERNQAGIESRIGSGEEWLDLSRGLHRESTNSLGQPTGRTKDEIAQRAIWKHYKDRMTQS
ncbi:aromatic ring-hydroxylating oxygenase subunit alpha [Micromonospora inositola]|uniref:Rieske [2Fe-2S] domain-containing protein n=1 Tax=Micromonospora inositola TaxID=47865 RepID=A0A1C5K5D2_9ACTN|nr:aromatic ring-hydroxylating dioxygenase subunit alpha [Micromonospora inositola]SCG77957.1 Rieske [2Fe-2S] domain-containing protein [Micromonospora inositola]